MGVFEIDTLEEWSEMKKDAERPIIVDFTASWCGPCRLLSPFFRELSEEYTDILYLKVDVDKAEDIAAECSVSSMPTFMVFIDGEKVDELVGADKEKLRQLVKKYAQAA